MQAQIGNEQWIKLIFSNKISEFQIKSINIFVASMALQEKIRLNYLIPCDLNILTL